MAVKTFNLSFRTRGDGHMLDITDVVSQTLKDSSLKAGIVSLFVPGSTAAHCLRLVEAVLAAAPDLQQRR
jgi:thiamine phosphate synthase YjbQ (UPF0047 family)